MGGTDGMFTDTKGLLDGGLKLVVDAWHEAQPEAGTGPSMDRYVTHQVTNAYTQAIIDAIDLDPRPRADHVPAVGQRGPGLAADDPRPGVADPRTAATGCCAWASAPA